MKYLCDSCERLVDAGAVRVEQGQLLLRCPKCDADSKVGAAPEGVQAVSAAHARAVKSEEPIQVNGRPVVVPFAPRPPSVQLAPEPEPVEIVPASERCPKCASPKNGRAACAKCGLIFDLYKPEQDVIPQSARREFARLLELQGKPEGERALDAVGPDQVPHLARLTRHHLADFPDDPRATAILDKLTARSLALAAAAAQSETLARSTAEPNRKVLILVIAALAIAALLGLLSVLVRSQ